MKQYDFARAWKNDADYDIEGPILILTLEEAIEMWNAGRTVGQQEITRENLSKVTAPHFWEYLESKGIRP